MRHPLLVGLLLSCACTGGGSSMPGGGSDGADTGTTPGRPLPRDDTGLDTDGGTADSGGTDTGPAEPGRPWQGLVDVHEADGVIITETTITDPDGTGECDYPQLAEFPEAVPDVTGDGVPDLLYMSSDICTDAINTIRVFSGLDESWSDETVAGAEIDAHTVQGLVTWITLLRNVGDVDGDGWDDVVVGQFYGSDYFDWPESGQLSLVSGPLVGPAVLGDITTAFLLSELPGRSNVGTSAVALGDQDGDGYDDFAVGSGVRVYNHEYADQPPFVQSTAWVLHGPITGTGKVRYAVLEDVSFAQVDMAVGDNVQTGARVASAGDQNGDGIIDLAIGSPNFPLVASGSGAVVVLYGPVAAGPLTWEDHDALIGDTGGGNSWSIFGYTVTGDLDMDGDGQDDLVVGSPGHQGDYCNDSYTCGAGFLLPGPLQGDVHVNDESTARVEGTETDGMLGASLSALGDVDGDGKDDVAVGAYNDYIYGEIGTVSIMYGGIEGVHIDRPGGVATDTALLYNTGARSQYLGDHLSGGQDLNQDGWPDLLVTDPHYRIRSALDADLSGRFYVLWGGLR